MTDSLRIKEKIGYLGLLLCLLIILAVGIWFRTYRLQESHFFLKKDSQAMVQGMVSDRIKGQLLEGLKQAQPGLDDEKREVLAERQFKEILTSDRSQFEKAVNDVLSQMPNQKTIEYSRHYLLEADPYHFYALTKRLVEKGRLSDKIENGRYFDPLRQTPHGYWTPVQWHPYLGVLCYRVLQKFIDLPLMETCSYYPILVLVFVVCAFYFLCDTLKFRLFTFLISGLTLVLAPVFLQRSSFGWFDTDIYNLLFPLILITLTLNAYRATKKKVLMYGVLLGVTTGIYSYFWVGWPFIFILLFSVTLVIMLLQKFLKIVYIQEGFFFLGAYLISLILFVVFVSSPSVIFEYFSRGLTFIGKFQASKAEAWPNVFFTVGEAHSLTFSRLIHLSGNKITFCFAFVGMTVVGLRRWLRRDRKEFLEWIFWIGMILPVAFLALRTERFSLLVVLPLTVFVGFTVNALLDWRDVFLQRFKSLKWIWSLKGLIGITIFLMLFPLQVFFAHALALNSKPIMNDVWYDTLQYLKENTPKNSIIHSWWPPGYFITAIAERRVFTDGGTQHHPECYWQARLFMSNSERETINILKMLNSGGNSAVDYLISKGYLLHEAMAFVDELLLVDEKEMVARCQTKLGGVKCEEFLELMQGRDAQAPTYFYIYNEMVEKNIAISLFSRWDFKKAYLAIQKPVGNEKKSDISETIRIVLFSGWDLKKIYLVIQKLLKDKKNSYLDEMIVMSDGVLRYEKEVQGQLEPNQRDVAFPNGVFFDLVSKQAVLNRPQNNVKGVPVNVVYFDGELFHEITNPGGLNIGVFVFKNENNYYSVIADKALILSLLFKLYYLNGRNSKVFEWINEEESVVTNTKIKVFKVNWSKV